MIADPEANPEVMLKSLNMTDEHDRGTLRRKIDDGQKRRRWDGVTDEFKAQAIQALKAALYMATTAKDHRGINGCVKTLALIEGQNQKDDHFEAGGGRGDVTVNVQQNQTIVVEHDRAG